MKKRAQTTIFIVIAMVIIAIIIGIYYFNQTKSQTDLEKVFSNLGISEQASVVESSIIDCLKTISKDSLEIIGLQGGYYNKPKKYFNLGWMFIPYYYYEGEYLMPSVEEIEGELSDSIEDSLNDCIKSLEFEDFEISYKGSNANTQISEREVGFKLDSVFTITKGDLSSEFKVEDYPIVVESKLFDILEVADYITESHKQDPEMYCISCVGDMLEIKNLYMDIVPFEDDDGNLKENQMLVVISENITSSEPYFFEFLNKYTGDEVSPLGAGSVSVGEGGKEESAPDAPEV